MAWTAPRLWTQGELVTASMMNVSVSDNLAYLKGGAGTVTIDAGMAVSGAVAANGALTGASVSATTLAGILTPFRVSADGQSVLRTSGGVDLGQASSGSNVGRIRTIHAYGGNVTLAATGSAGIIIGEAIFGVSGQVIITHADSYTLYAAPDNYWELI